MNTKLLPILLAAYLLASPRVSAQTANPFQQTSSDYFKTDEARKVGDNVLLWQRVTGGWPKNIDMSKELSPAEQAAVKADRQRTDDSTIDNGATTTQMMFLARLYRQTKTAKYKEGFLSGLQYLLDGQYPNGGWPQFWPVQNEAYSLNITFNDDAMINTMNLFRDIIAKKAPFDGNIVDNAMRKRLQESVDKGIDIILKCQIVVNGEPTVWCQQHDPETLAPASARAYELPSYCSQESAALVRFLMGLPNPDDRIKKAINGAMKWFDTYKLTGLRVERVNDPKMGRITRLVEDPSATPIWGRFYDLEHTEPYVCDRDGIPRRHLEQIGFERRSGYSWYGSRAADLYPLYEAWAAKYDPSGKVNISLKTKGANETGLIDMYRPYEKDMSAFDVTVHPGESIQAAIDKAPADGTKPFRIMVLNGRYEQSIDINKPNVVLVGQSREGTVIEQNGQGRSNGLVISISADDCTISSLTISNNYTTEGIPVEQAHWLPHRFAVRGTGTRTIIVNTTINSTGNDALALWAAGGNGMYYHADMDINCPGVDFICPRGWCYATRCHFYGDSRAMIWHDGRGDKNKKFVITNSTFDAKSPTLLGRYHHDAQIYIVNCRMSKNILDQNIHYAYSDQVLDPCEWGERIYYYGNYREGGNSLWLSDNMHLAPGSPRYYTTTATWTFDGKWDPEQTIRNLWNVLAY